MQENRIPLHQTTSHSSLLVARQGDVSRELNQAFLLVDSFNFNFVDEERSDIVITIYDKCLPQKAIMYLQLSSLHHLLRLHNQHTQKDVTEWSFILLRYYFHLEYMEHIGHVVRMSVSGYRG